MFLNTDSFNSDISKWDVSKPPDVRGMLQRADAFDQPPWCTLAWWSNQRDVRHKMRGIDTSATFQNRNNLPFCCNPGEYLANITTLHCKRCPAGEFRGNISASATCYKCPLGFIGEYSAVKCSRCVQTGTYSNKERTQCQTCAVGTYMVQRNDDREYECSPCQPGHYQDQPGQTSCLLCPAGQYGHNTKTFCQSCDVGQYGHDQKCTKCKAPNTFVDYRGATTCTSCPRGKRPNTARTGCIMPPWGACKIGEYLNNKNKNESQWQCVVCPDGADCETNDPLPTWSSLRHKKHYWSVPGSTDMNGPFMRCPGLTTCGSSTRNTTTRNCSAGNTGVLCAVCMPNYFQTSSCQCVHCKENARQTLENVILPFSLLVLLAIALYTKRKKIKELRRKYSNTLRDMLRIITISFSYAQINSSLPQVLTVPFPTGYLTFLDKLDFVNLDIMGMVGIGCMENVDFRWRVAMVSLVVPLSVLFLYLCRQKELDENASKVLNGLFDSVDVNGSGHIDADEFQTLLVEMNQPETTVDQRIVQMKELGAVGNDRHDVLLPRAAFIDAAENKKLETVLGTHWVRRVAANQARSERWSNTLVLLFLMHAPVSQRLFYYFSCNAVGEKKYLVQDYSIACGENKHSEFAPFVVFMLLFFTFGLPLVVSGLLFAKRKSLYNPKVHAMMGFLYARFKVGSEFWEIHEVVRKCLLMGFLIFLPPTSRSAIAILICVVCCCTLNFFQPHRNKLVLFVSQLSFFNDDV
jgi:hypothetical protein